jgi:hypothetical protein
MRVFGVFGGYAFELYEAESWGNTRREQPDNLHWVRATLIPYFCCYSRLIRL